MLFVLLLLLSVLISIVIQAGGATVYFASCDPTFSPRQRIRSVVCSWLSLATYYLVHVAVDDPIKPTATPTSNYCVLMMGASCGHDP